MLLQSVTAVDAIRNIGLWTLHPQIPRMLHQKRSFLFPPVQATNMTWKTGGKRAATGHQSIGTCIVMTGTI